MGMCIDMLEPTQACGKWEGWLQPDSIPHARQNVYRHEETCVIFGKRTESFGMLW